MTFREKYDRTDVGALAGFLIPVAGFLLSYLFLGKHLDFAGYINKIVKADILTHVISLSVLPNIFLFLIFNRLDMLSSARGVLGITIFWAVVVFLVKFLL